jgi:hypothetical protein
MTTYRNLVSKVGRSVLPVKASYTVFSTRQTPRGWVAFVNRQRRHAGQVNDAYMVVRSPHPIVSNGTLLLRLPAVLHSTGRFEKRMMRSGRAIWTQMADARTWFSDHDQAEAAFNLVVHRGGR